MSGAHSFIEGAQRADIIREKDRGPQVFNNVLHLPTCNFQASLTYKDNGAVHAQLCMQLGGAGLYFGMSIDQVDHFIEQLSKMRGLMLENSEKQAAAEIKKAADK